MDVAGEVSSWVSTGVMVLLVVGILHRHRPRLHVPIMFTCFGIDLANVVFIEVRRNAVETAVRSFTGAAELVLRFHILVSVLTVLCYLVAAATGLRLLYRGRGRRFHRANAVVFILARTANYVTSFYV